MQLAFTNIRFFAQFVGIFAISLVLLWLVGQKCVEYDSSHWSPMKAKVLLAEVRGGAGGRGDPKKYTLWARYVVGGNHVNAEFLPIRFESPEEGFAYRQKVLENGISVYVNQRTQEVCSSPGLMKLQEQLKMWIIAGLSAVALATTIRKWWYRRMQFLHGAEDALRQKPAL